MVDNPYEPPKANKPSPPRRRIWTRASFIAPIAMIVGSYAAFAVGTELGWIREAEAGDPLPAFWSLATFGFAAGAFLLLRLLGR